MIADNDRIISSQKTGGRVQPQCNGEGCQEICLCLVTGIPGPDSREKVELNKMKFKFPNKDPDYNPDFKDDRNENQIIRDINMILNSQLDKDYMKCVELMIHRNPKSKEVLKSGRIMDQAELRKIMAKWRELNYLKDKDDGIVDPNLETGNLEQHPYKETFDEVLNDKEALNASEQNPIAPSSIWRP